MNSIFHGPAAGELNAFLEFKRSLGYGYLRAEFTLREFDRFLPNTRWQLDSAGCRASLAVSRSACPAMPRFSGSSTVTCADYPSQGP